jgi:hypothetical protein
MIRRQRIRDAGVLVSERLKLITSGCNRSNSILGKRWCRIHHHCMDIICKSLVLVIDEISNCT